MTRARTRRQRRGEVRLPAGTPPGTIHVDPNAPKPRLAVIAYGRDSIEEHPIEDLAELHAVRGRFPVVWLDVQGLGDAALIEAIGREFGLHRLALEDTVGVHQRAKVELYKDHLYFVARAPEPGRPEDDHSFGTEQLSLFLGPNFVVTFQERPGDGFEPVRARLRRAGPIRSQGPDYLAYALIDAIVDGWFPVLEHCGERLEDLEDSILERPSRDTIFVIHTVRRDLLQLRRAVWPLRDALGMLYREQTPLVREETKVYLRDCYDHAVQIIDLLESARDTATELTDVYLSSVSNRMNEVMKVLTVISTVFLPLSFIASLYGMNFKFMPELEWKYGYAWALALMVATVLFMLGFFWRKGWLRPAEEQPRK